MNPIPPPFSYIAYVVVQDIINKKTKTKKNNEQTTNPSLPSNS